MVFFLAVFPLFETNLNQLLVLKFCNGFEPIPCTEQTSCQLLSKSCKACGNETLWKGKLKLHEQSVVLQIEPQMKC